MTTALKAYVFPICAIMSLMTCLGESRSIVCRPVTNRLYIPDQMDCDFHAKLTICPRNDELHHTLLLLEHLCFSRNMLDTMLKPISGLCRVFHAQILRLLFVIVFIGAHEKSSTRSTQQGVIICA